MFRVTETILHHGQVVKITAKEFDHIVDAQKYMEDRRRAFAMKRLQATTENQGAVFIGVEQKFEILPVAEKG